MSLLAKTAAAFPPRHLPRHPRSLGLLRRLFAASLIIYLSTTLLWPESGSADEASGTWSGSLQGALNYYYERSTRVVMPEGRIAVESPDGLRLSASTLVDVITSASVFAGRTEDALASEYRIGPQVGVGKTFSFDDLRFSADATARYSTENDYESISGGLDFGLFLNADNTVLRLGIAHLRDRIFANNTDMFEGKVIGWSGQLGLEQVLNPTMVFTVGYQVGHQEGYLGNPYRSVGLQAAPQMEQPPGTRIRHGLSGRLAWYIPPAAMAVHLLSRFYIDTWEVKSFSPELRLYKEIGRLLMLRLRYRFYTQTGADFYRLPTEYPRDWDGPFTRDYKLAPLRSHTVGVRLDLETNFLERTIFDFAADSTIYLALNRVFTNHFYGNETVGTGGGIWRF